MLSTLTGHNDFEEMVIFAEARLEILRKYIKLENGIPHKDTIKRVVAIIEPNQLNFVLPAVKQEVNIEDLCLLESIKTIDVQAYLQINSCKSALLKEHDYLYAHINQKAEEKQVQNRYDEALGSITKGLNAEESVKIKKIVNTLFGDRIGINSFAQPLRDAKNICTSTYFNLYFIQAVPQGVISNTIINAS